MSVYNKTIFTIINLLTDIGSVFSAMWSNRNMLLVGIKILSIMTIYACVLLKYLHLHSLLHNNTLVHCAMPLTGLTNTNNLYQWHLRDVPTENNIWRQKNCILHTNTVEPQQQTHANLLNFTDVPNCLAIYAQTTGTAVRVGTSNEFSHHSSYPTSPHLNWTAEVEYRYRLTIGNGNRNRVMMLVMTT